MYLCMCVGVYVLFLLLATRISIQHFNKKNVVELNFYIQIVYMFRCCHIITVANEMHLHVIQVTRFLYVVLSDERKFLLTGLFPTFFVREQPLHHVHMHDMLYQ